MDGYDKRIFSKNLIQRMDLAGKRPADLCLLLDVSKSTVSSWYNAQKMPRMDKIEKIANYLGIQKSDLIEDKPVPEPANSYPVGSFVRIPVIGRVLAGVGGLAEEEFLGYELAADVTAPKEHRYFLVKGDSMLPEIREGDRALVHIQDDVECGELAVVIVNGEEGLIKKVMKHANAISLVSFNTNYPPRLFIGEEMNTVRIWGKVKKVERSY